MLDKHFKSLLLITFTNKVVSRQLTLESGLGGEIHLLSIIKFKSVAPRWPAMALQTFKQSNWRKILQSWILPSVAPTLKKVIALHNPLIISSLGPPIRKSYLNS